MFVGELASRGSRRCCRAGLTIEVRPRWHRSGSPSFSLDYLRFIAIPLILLFAAARRRGVRGAPLTVELGAVTAPGSLSALITESLGDSTARVLYPSAGGWVDDVGHPTQRPSGERQMTVVERDSEVVAAIDHGVVVRPAALEAAAGTLALLAEHRALEARTQGRVRELRRLRSTVLEAEDAVRRRLERDLHDGAQQQILALALQSRLCAAEGGDRLGVEIDRVRCELLEIAEGLTEGVIRERGLHSFLEALAAMSPVPVELCADVPADLDAPVAATAWFVASEAVGNAAKHAAAMQVTVDVRPVGDVLMVTVSDDGCGGADPAGGGLSRSGAAGPRARRRPGSAQSQRCRDGTRRIATPGIDMMRLVRVAPRPRRARRCRGGASRPGTAPTRVSVRDQWAGDRLWRQPGDGPRWLGGVGTAPATADRTVADGGGVRRHLGLGCGTAPGRMVCRRIGGLGMFSVGDRPRAVGLSRRAAPRSAAGGGRDLLGGSRRARCVVAARRGLVASGSTAAV